MKILKTKNKLSIFDLLIITSVIFILAVLGYFFLRRSKMLEATVKVTNGNILYSNADPPSWFSEYFKEGMTAKDWMGRKIAKLKNVYRYDTSPSNKAVYLTLDLKVDYSKGEDKYTYEGKTLSIGSPIKIELEDILVEGLVTHIEGVVSSGKAKEMLVETQLEWGNIVFPETYGVSAFVVDAINVGDKIRDSLGDILITVQDKKAEPAKKIVTDSKGNLFVAKDPLKKDLYLTLNLQVKEVSNGIHEKEYYLFDDVRIKINEIVPLHFQDISIYPKVTKILEVR